MTVTATYASLQLGPVGSLYDAILAISIVLACLAIIAGALVLLSSLGVFRNPARYSTFRTLVLLILVISLFLVILVPTVQGAVIRQSGNSGAGLCNLYNSTTNPCTAFWGSASGAGNTDTWGADAGWYLVLVSTILLAVGLFLWRSARAAPWGAANLPIGAASYSSFAPTATPPQESPVDRLLRAKALADAGMITPAEFADLKARLMDRVAVPESIPGSTPPARPEDELAKLKALHDSGGISDTEYEGLRKKVLLRF